MQTPDVSKIEPNEYSAAFLFDVFKAVGIAGANLTFSGGGDSGDIDDIDLTDRPSVQDVRKALALAFATHHLLYPEMELEGLKFSPDSKEPLEDAVRSYTEHFIFPGLGDWYNNDGGRGEVSFNTAARLVEYACHYHEVKSGDEVCGEVPGHPVLVELIAAMRSHGISRIRSNRDFDSCGDECYSEDAAYNAADVSIEIGSVPDALWSKLDAVLQTHFPNAERPCTNIGDLLDFLHETFVRGPFEDSSVPDEGEEGYSLSYNLTEESGQPCLSWSGTPRYMDEGEGDGGEIEAPKIGLVKAPRKTRRRAKRSDAGRSGFIHFKSDPANLPKAA